MDDNRNATAEGSRNGLVGRAGLKLEAAISTFALADAIRDARAVDVGASTGGFTEVLLSHGAAHVLAVDAGHGQLHERLRRDPRVQSLERVDWKRLSLSETAAAGPFDFFTVDVSFVAARNMLRGLAFRLRPGAVGVVLIKPQFELPDHLVRGGDVRDPGLRRLAVARFTAKATALGFEVRRLIDSPVAGGGGTIEILAEVLFHGRTERLPAFQAQDQDRDSGSGDNVDVADTVARRAQPGSVSRTVTPIPARSRPSARTRNRAALPLAASSTHRWFAVSAPGTEEIAATELAALLPEVEDVRAVPGGVEWRGSIGGALRANLMARVPTRILLRLAEARAREFGKLRHQLARLPWEQFVEAGLPVRASISATRSRLYHTGAIEEALMAALGDRFGTDAPATRAARRATADGSNGSASVIGGDAPPAADDPAGPAPQNILLRGVDDVWTVSVDTSGERLHRRGWRTDGGEAPLRETLAAAMLYFAGWQPGQALVDPMCGAGTLPIEAATMALGLAPGANRAFAFERWPGLSASDRAGWTELRRAALDAPARAAIPVPLAPIPQIWASDRDATAVEATRRNAERAEVAAAIQLTVRPLNDVDPPASTGVFVANPPYGERLGTRRELPALYRSIGGLLRARFHGWHATVVVPDIRLASAFRLPIEASLKLTHGGLKVTLLRFAP